MGIPGVGSDTLAPSTVPGPPPLPCNGTRVGSTDIVHFSLPGLAPARPLAPSTVSLPVPVPVPAEKELPRPMYPDRLDVRAFPPGAMYMYVQVAISSRGRRQEAPLHQPVDAALVILTHVSHVWAFSGLVPPVNGTSPHPASRRAGIIHGHLQHLALKLFPPPIV